MDATCAPISRSTKHLTRRFDFHLRVKENVMTHGLVWCGELVCGNYFELAQIVLNLLALINVLKLPSILMKYLESTELP